MEGNYDITAKVPIKQFKVKVRIRSIERMKPKVAVDEVMEVMDLPDILVHLWNELKEILINIKKC